MSKCRCILFWPSVVILQAVCCWLVVAGGNSSQQVVVAAAASGQIGGAPECLQDPRLSPMSWHARDDLVGDDDDLADHGAAPAQQPEAEAAADAEAGDVDLDGGEVECPVCGKRFRNDKSMFGHLRSHPNRGYKGATPPLNLSTTPSSSLPAAVDDTLLLLPFRDSSNQSMLSVADVCLSTYEKMAACVMATLRYRYRPRRQLQQPQAQAAAAGAGIGEVGTSSTMEGDVIHRDGRRKGKRKLTKEPLREKELKRRHYTCKHCNEEFSTHQALGGHMAGNHKEKRILKEAQLARSAMILEQKQPDMNLGLKEEQPERSRLVLREKQPDVYQDRVIDQTMDDDWEETEIDGSNAVPVAEEEDGHPPFGFDLNVEAPEQE
ncbi:uncharacterized protein LOC107304538 [Oryza brachyantha]|uniref:C2H2-type domain-containing protein n=1 Tax=Oryza brachyantha TaxID=4533 RepID=J3MK41_ORYBR|nr:uncharacterized protein LOC107304538 [Oryza brachyantha]